MNVRRKKWYFNEKYRYKYLSNYRSKEIRFKVKKKFMSDDEYISIKTLFDYCKTDEDLQFLLQTIETSKTYRHYRKLFIHGLNYNIDKCQIEQIFDQCKHKVFSKTAEYWIFIMEWLFSYTIHTKKLLEFVHSQENKK